MGLLLPSRLTRAARLDRRPLRERAAPVSAGLRRASRGRLGAGDLAHRRLRDHARTAARSGSGRSRDAGWSPRGQHVVGVDGRRLDRGDPDGRRSSGRSRAQAGCTIPPGARDEGFAVAYLEGDALCAVAGDGDPATTGCFAAAPRPSRPAWRPRSDRVLTYATAGGRIETVDVDTGRTLWRTGAAVAARRRALAWSRTGAARRRSVAVGGRARADGRVLRIASPLPGAGRELALHPSGAKRGGARSGAARAACSRCARTSRRRRGTRGELFQGDVDGLAWSQNGRRLLLGWRGAGQWLLLGPGGRVRALHDVSPRARRGGRLPARGGLVLRRASASARSLDLHHLLEGRAVDPVDQRLVDRSDRALAHRVVAPLARRASRSPRRSRPCRRPPGPDFSARFSDARSRDWHFRRVPCALPDPPQ